MQGGCAELGAGCGVGVVAGGGVGGFGQEIGCVGEGVVETYEEGFVGLFCVLVEADFLEEGLAVLDGEDFFEEGEHSELGDVLLLVALAVGARDDFLLDVVVDHGLGEGGFFFGEGLLAVDVVEELVHVEVEVGELVPGGGTVFAEGFDGGRGLGLLGVRRLLRCGGKLGGCGFGHKNLLRCGG